MNAEKQIEEMVEFLNNKINVERNSYFGKGRITISLIEAEKILALIKELTRKLEIANLEIECKERICESYALQYGTVADKEVWLKKERADTVRKMQERIKERMSDFARKGSGEQTFYLISKSFIDKIAKEMLEGAG